MPRAGQGPAPGPRRLHEPAIADRVRFLRAFAANPRQVGAILPTSRYAVRDMLDLGDVPGAGLVVELGAGTGVQTGEILARMRPDARLVALEIDPALARLLEERFDDPRLQVVCDSAEHLEKHLDGEQADVLVCALPFTSLEPGLRRRILDALPRRAGAARHGAGHPVLAADPVGAAPALPVGPPPDLAAERAAGVPVRLLARSPTPTAGPAGPSAAGGERGDLVRGLQRGGAGERPRAARAPPAGGRGRSGGGRGRCGGRSWRNLSDLRGGPERAPGEGAATTRTSTSGVKVEPGSSRRISPITRSLSGWTVAVSVRTPRAAARSMSSTSS